MEAISTTKAIAISVMTILGILSKRTKTKLSQDYNDVIQFYNDAQNDKYPYHARSRVVIAKERLDSFKLAFYGEIEKELSSKK